MLNTWLLSSEIPYNSGEKKHIYNNQNFGDIYRQFWDSLLKIAIKVNIRILYLIKARMKDICTKYNQSRTSTSGLFCLFICIFVQNITKAGFQYKQRIFFYFVAWLSLIFFDFWWYSQLFGNKSWTQGCIHEVQKKSWHRLDIRLRRRASLRSSRIRKWVQFILYSHLMKPPLFQDLLPNIPETIKNWSENQWNQDTKKISRFILITI